MDDVASTRPYCPAIHTAFDRALTIATQGNYQIYELRRSYLLWLRRVGVDPTVRRMVIGHRDNNVAHPYESMRNNPNWLDRQADVLTARKQLRCKMVDTQLPFQADNTLRKIVQLIATTE